MAAIPPDPEAIREAMSPPERPAGRGRMFLALGLVVALGVIFVQGFGPSKRNNEPVVIEKGTAHFVDTYNHPEGFRFLLTLAPDRSGRRAEIETLMVFGYSVARADTQKARDAIERNWTRTQAQIARMLESSTRSDLVNRLETVTESAQSIMNRNLFGTDISAKVEVVNWQYVKFL